MGIAASTQNNASTQTRTIKYTTQELLARKKKMMSDPSTVGLNAESRAAVEANAFKIISSSPLFKLPRKGDATDEMEPEPSYHP